MKKLYIYWPDDWWEWAYYLLTEDWYSLASHFCSDSSFAEEDLIERRPERKEEWKEYLKDWYELIFADKEIKANLKTLNKKFSGKEKSYNYKRSVLKLTN
jgi:hypothetical protein